MGGTTFEARRSRSSSLRLAALMGAFAVFAVAVLVDEDLLAGNSYRSIDDRGTQLIIAAATLVLVAGLLPMALLDLQGRPAVRFDREGGEVRVVVRRRFRWDDVAAVEGGAKSFRIRLRRGRLIRVAGEFEGHDVMAIYAVAVTYWTSAAPC